MILLHIDTSILGGNSVSRELTALIVNRLTATGARRSRHLPRPRERGDPARDCGDHAKRPSACGQRGSRRLGSDGTLRQ